MQRIRLPITSVEEADEAIRLWLANKKNKNKVKPVTKQCDTLFLRAIDDSVFESSYHVFQNRKKKFGRPALLQTEPTKSCPTVIQKLKRARYAKEKRVARAEFTHHKVRQVIYSYNTHICICI